MGKVIASYLARITLREPSDLAHGKSTFDPPTIARLEEGVKHGVESIEGTVRETDGPDWYEVNVTAERTDR